MAMPSMPNLPGVGAVTDTLEFMKSLWGGAKMPGVSLPGMVMPTLSVEEIDKQIADLKAVESWLTVNMNMLHGTIKALEVQSATISTLQSMSANFSAAMKPAASKKPIPTEESAPFESPFMKAAAAPVPPPAQADTHASAGAADGHASDNPHTAAPGPIPNPAAWWGMLQEQFKQAVASATMPMDATKPTKSPKPARSTVADKPAAKVVKRKPTAAKAKGKPKAVRKV